MDTDKAPSIASVSAIADGNSGTTPV